MSIKRMHLFPLSVPCPRIDHHVLVCDRALLNASSITPQPVVFNLCVANGARRSGVASHLVQRCEDQAREWGDSRLFLKVRQDNDAARQLYQAKGYQLLEGRSAPELPAWQERWKGGAMPLELMYKQLFPPSAATLRAKQPAEFTVSLDKVLAYDDWDAVLWFVLLILRNRDSLSPVYGALSGAAAAAAGLATWLLLVTSLWGVR